MERSKWFASQKRRPTIAEDILDKHYPNEEYPLNGYKKDILLALQEAVKEWKDIKNDLPKEGGRYWCNVVDVTELGRSEFQWNCYYDPKDKEFRDDLKRMNVTHWTELMPHPHHK